MAIKPSKFKRLLHEAMSLWDDSALRSQPELSKLQKFVHFWVLVARSFSRNRCPVRASGLAYVTLLALVPMLAVVVSITSTFLKKEGEDRIDEFIVKMVASMTPPAMLTTNYVATITNVVVQPKGTNALEAATGEVTNKPTFSSSGARTNEILLPAFAQDEQAVRARKDIAKTINKFIQNTRSGALGLTGSVLLIFAAISLLARIEDTFNDIWGVSQGRNWFMRIVLYWTVISLAPLLLVVAIGLATGPHLESSRRMLMTMPVVGHYISAIVFHLLPVLVLCVTFMLLYMLIPNTKISWRAAVVGGLTGGILWHLNNLASVLFVSRVVSNSKIYGSLALVPVFMIGLYFAWLIMLFGAQVAYAFQNRAAYLEERLIENINQRGREFVALRLMTSISLRFVRGDAPPGTVELGAELCVPTRLIQQVLRTLCAARLVLETAGADSGFVPARPLETITCHDILLALRSGHGQELTTSDGPNRNEVYGEYQRIEEAERNAASSVTMLALASRAQEPKRVLGGMD
jgi:membrane protein